MGGVGEYLGRAGRAYREANELDVAALEDAQRNRPGRQARALGWSRLCDRRSYSRPAMRMGRWSVDAAPVGGPPSALILCAWTYDRAWSGTGGHCRRGRIYPVSSTAMTWPTAPGWHAVFELADERLGKRVDPLEPLDRGDAVPVLHDQSERRAASRLSRLAPSLGALVQVSGEERGNPLAPRKPATKR